MLQIVHTVLPYDHITNMACKLHENVASIEVNESIKCG